ncbi:MAG: hypothetical protein ACAI44_03305 [Candidatus Sericytochromatia bacterium]
MQKNPVPRWKQRLAGVFIALIGGGGTAWGWYTALNAGYYYPKASFAFPAFCVLGLGMILIQGYTEERLARGEDISGLHGWRMLTPRWWVILVLCFVAGLSNFALLASR